MARDSDRGEAVAPQQTEAARQFLSIDLEKSRSETFPGPRHFFRPRHVTRTSKCCSKYRNCTIGCELRRPRKSGTAHRFEFGVEVTEAISASRACFCSSLRRVLERALDRIQLVRMSGCGIAPPVRGVFAPTTGQHRAHYNFYTVSSLKCMRQCCRTTLL